MIGTVNDKYFREDGLLVFLCTDPAGDVRDVYSKKAIAEKKLYRRE
jgi:hypothetical protein